MLIKVPVFCLCIILSQIHNSFAQDSLSSMQPSHLRKDSIVLSTHLVPRIALYAPKAFMIEATIGIQRLAIGHAYNSFNFNSTQAYLGCEYSLRHLTNPLLGPKLGYEFCGLGHVTSFGAIEYIHYTDFEKQSPALRLKLGIPLVFASISYGYTMFLIPDLRNKIGKHSVCLAYTWNPRAQKKFSKMLSKEKGLSTPEQ